MTINYLNVCKLRILKETSLSFDQRCNYVMGANGSGKTSLLEAIYILGTARSFRTRNAVKLISYSENDFSIFATLSSEDKLGISKNRAGETVVKFNQDNFNSTSALAKVLPIQLLTSDSFYLIDSSPKFRRNLLDWGVFHVKPEFMEFNRQYKHILKQRNHLLRTSSDKKLIASWNEPLLYYANMLNTLRTSYLESFLVTFSKLYESLGNAKLDICYYSGWNRDSSDFDLEILTSSLENDLKYKYTTLGPHAADLEIKCNNYLAKDFLSRGQQKLVLVCLKLAQGLHFSSSQKKPILYLFDDLAAEFDDDNLAKIARMLMEIDGQFFFTSVSRSLVDIFKQYLPGKLFHVEQGKITQIR